MLSEPYNNIYKPVRGKDKRFTLTLDYLVGLHCLVILQLQVLAFYLNTRLILIANCL